MKATRAIAAKDYVTAIKLLEKADALNNGSKASVKLILAELYMRRNQPGQARKEVDDALALEPDSIVGWRMAMPIYLRSGDAAGALAFADRILSQPGNEKDTNALTVKLEALVQMNRLADADDVAAELTLLGSKMNWPIQKARILSSQGKTEEAEALLKQVLKNTPGDKTATLLMGNLLFQRDQLSQAQELAKAALTKNPGDKDLQRFLRVASISDKQKRADEIRAIMKEVTEARLEEQMTKAEEEKDPFLREIMLANQYLKRNNTAEARKHMDQAIKLDRKRANYYNFQFALNAKDDKGTRDWARAQECVDFAKTNNLDSLKGLSYEAEMTNARGWEQLNRYRSLVKANKSEEAKKAIDEAKRYFMQSMKACELIIMEMPNESQTHALLGEAYFWLDRRNDASVQISKALELNSQNPYALRAICVQQWDAISTKTGTDSDLVNSFVQNLQQAYQQLPWDEWIQDRINWLRQQMAKQTEYEEDEKGDAIKAVARREKIRKDKPDDVENLIRLARIYETRDAVRDLDKAEECFQSALAKDPGESIVQAYAEFASRTRRIENVEKYLKEFAEKQAKSGQANGYALLGQFYLLMKNGEKAENSLTQAMKVEDTAARRLQLAAFYIQTGNLAKAAEWARNTLQTKMDSRQEQIARSLLIDSLLALNDWDQAKSQIDDYLKRYDKAPDGKIFQARLALGMGQMFEAERILNEVLTANANYLDALDLRSTVYLFTWQYEKARADLELIQKLSPRMSNLAGQIKLIKLYCEMGRSADAERLTRDLIKTASEKQTNWLEGIRTDILPALACSLGEQQYEELLVWMGNATRGYWGWPFERGRYYLMKKKYDLSSQAFAQAWEAVSNAPVGLKMMVLDSYFNALIKSGTSRSQAKLLETAKKALTEMPEASSRILIWSAAANYVGGQEQKGLELYLKALSTESNPLMVWQSTRNTMLIAIKADKLVESLEKANKTTPGSKNIMIALASSYFSADEPAKGEAIYRQLVDSTKNPKDKAMILYFLGQDYTDKGRYTEAVKVLAEARQHDPQDIAVQNNLAYLLVEYLNKSDESMDLIKSAYRSAPNNPDVLDTYGQVLIKSGKDNEGLYYTAKSIWLRDSAASRYHLGLILKKQNRRADAEVQLRRALDMVGDDKALEKQIRLALGSL